MNKAVTGFLIGRLTSRHEGRVVTKPLHTATQTKTPRAKTEIKPNRKRNLPDLHRIHFDTFSKALHPRRCRRAHRGDPRNSNARLAHHMRLLSRPPPPTPTPLPRHVRRSQRPARRSRRPAQFTSGRHTTCDYYRGRHLRDPHPSSPLKPCDCVCEVIARPTRDSLGTCEVCARQRLSLEEHSSVSGCQPCHSFLGAVVTRCGRVLCCVARYDASDCCAAVNFRALRWLASLGHMLRCLSSRIGPFRGGGVSLGAAGREQRGYRAPQAAAGRRGA